MEDQRVITGKVTVAAGPFAPGHLGELTQIVPFEMVDHALAATGTTLRGARSLPVLVTCADRQLTAIGNDDDPCLSVCSG